MLSIPPSLSFALLSVASILRFLPPHLAAHGSTRLRASYREQYQWKKSRSFRIVPPKFPGLDFHGRLDQAPETRWLEFSDWLRVGHTPSQTCDEMVPVVPKRQLVPPKKMGTKTGKMDMKQAQTKNPLYAFIPNFIF